MLNQPSSAARGGSHSPSRPARIVCFDDWKEKWATAQSIDLLKQSGVVDLLTSRSEAPEEGWRTLAGVDGYQISPQVEMRGDWRADQRLLGRCPQLLAVCSTGSGYDVIDVEACTRAGVIVCSQAGGNKEAVAEHALGMMLSLSKKIGYADKVMRRHVIDRMVLEGRDIRGRTLGIVGIGHIGTRLAEICTKAFGMTVLACDPYLSAAEVEARGARKVDMAELFRQPDFVSLHCPRSAETMGMVGREQFALMKPSAFFITTARGGVHREDDLVEALAQKRIAGAGVDVFVEEPPPPEHPLLRFDNVVVTPHIAGTTVDSVRIMAAANAEQWLDIFAGRVPPRLINREAWPAYSRRFEAAFGFRPEAIG